MESITLNKLITKITSVSDRKQKAFLLIEQLSSLSCDVLTELLEDIVNFTLRNDYSCNELLSSITDILENIFSFEIDGTLHQLYRSIKQLNTSNRTLKLFLSPPAPHRFLKRGELHKSDILMDYLPLGTKRSLAKKMDNNLIRRMLLEKDPIVIKNLLLNPLITEKEVLKIVSNRPNTEKIIKVIYASDKWIKNYSVKEAIIKNPYSPFRIALLLLFSMNIKELQQIKNDGTLHPEIRMEAKRLETLRSYLQY